MRIEAATEHDGHAIADVHVASWRAAYVGIAPAHYLASLSVEQREAGWNEALAKGEPEVLVARTDGHITGFIACGACRDQGAHKHVAEVWALYVVPSRWSSGVGCALWLQALRRLRARGFGVVTAWVLARNERGRRFYQAAGFEVERGSTRTFALGGAELEELRLVYEDAV